jgi:hypothetical protein
VKRDKYITRNNPTATWHTSLYHPPPHPPTHPEPPTTCAKHSHWPDLPQPYTQPRYKLPGFPLHPTVYFQPLKMELIQGSETSANCILTRGIYPKEHIHYSNHGESLKSKILKFHSP